MIYYQLNLDHSEVKHFSEWLSSINQHTSVDKDTETRERSALLVRMQIEQPLWKTVP